MTVSVLLDNDVVIKLARMDAYLDALSSLELTPRQVGSLKPMLRYMGLYDKSRLARFTDNAAEAARLLAALKSVVVMEMTPQEAALATNVGRAVLSAGLDIKEGELMMCVVAVSRGNLDFCTADKRALNSLPNVETYWADVGNMRGRCICFEELFYALCRKFGLARVTQAVRTCPTTEKSMTRLHDVSVARGQDHFLHELERYVEDRISRSARGWLKP